MSSPACSADADRELRISQKVAHVIIMAVLSRRHTLKQKAKLTAALVETAHELGHQSRERADVYTVHGGPAWLQERTRSEAEEASRIVARVAYNALRTCPMGRGWLGTERP